jgi:hypothetical protein
MKRLSIVCIACLCLFTAQAQKGINFGVKAGVNFASLTGSDADGLKGLTSFHFGAVVHVPFGHMWAFQPELIYSGQGATSDATPKEKALLGYLTVPIIFQYVNASGFYAETGPEIGFLMSAKDKPESGSSTDIKDIFKSTDFLWGFGIGYRMKSGFGIGGRYNVGLSNILDASGSDMKNSVINLGVFYYFGGDKK